MDHLAPYNWAKKEIGIKEIAGNGHNQRIIYYHSFTTLKATSDETAWCSAFMCAAAELNGFKSTKSAAAISWESYGIEVPIESAKKGDIVILGRKSKDNPNARHVAFLDEDINANDQLIKCLGGNQKDSVCVSNFKKDSITTVRRFA